MEYIKIRGVFMLRLVPSWNISPKDGVTEKIDVNQNKKWNIFFGILEFSNIYAMIMIIIKFFKSHAENLEIAEDIPSFFQVIPYMQVILVLSIIATGILYFCNKLVAYKIYFVQFFFRLLFFIPSFGVLLEINLLVKNSVFYIVLGIVCVILEICRFIVSIFIVHESNRYV